MKRIPKATQHTPLKAQTLHPDELSQTHQPFSILNRENSVKQMPQNRLKPESTQEDICRTGGKKVPGLEQVTQSQPPALDKIVRPTLIKSSSVSALPKFPTDQSKLLSTNLPSKPELIRYQFQTPPKTRTPSSLPSNYNYNFHPNPARLQESLLRQRLPKLDIQPLSLPQDTFKPVSTQKSDSLPITQRATPENRRTSMTRMNEVPNPARGAVFPPVVFSVGVRTRTGANNGKQKKFNQDVYMVSNHFAGTKNQCLFSVCDGHGLHGHEVSAFIKRNLHSRIAAAIPRIRTIQHSASRPASTTPLR